MAGSLAEARKGVSDQGVGWLGGVRGLGSVRPAGLGCLVSDCSNGTRTPRYGAARSLPRRRPSPTPASRAAPTVNGCPARSGGRSVHRGIRSGCRCHTDRRGHLPQGRGHRRWRSADRHGPGHRHGHRHGHSRRRDATNRPIRADIGRQVTSRRRRARAGHRCRGDMSLLDPNNQNRATGDVSAHARLGPTEACDRPVTSRPKQAETGRQVTSRRRRARAGHRCRGDMPSTDANKQKQVDR